VSGLEFETHLLPHYPRNPGFYFQDSIYDDYGRALKNSLSGIQNDLCGTLRRTDKRNFTINIFRKDMDDRALVSRSIRIPFKLTRPCSLCSFLATNDV